MQVHDEVPRLRVPVPHFALIAMGVMCHLILLEGKVWTFVSCLRGDCDLVIVVVVASIAATAAVAMSPGAG